MSTLPSDTPRLPKWPFLVGDAILLGVAVTIASRAPAPYTNAVAIAISACVVLAALLGAIPFLADYAAKQDEALDERQRGLEALTRTVAESAEQISIAANGIHELNDFAQKYLKQAEALPGKLQERIHNFNRQLNEATVAENEALQQEVNSLRASDLEKLETVAERTAKAIAELTKLDAAVAKQLAAAREALAQVPKTLADLPAAIARVRDEALQSIAAAHAAALAELSRSGSHRPAAPAAPPTVAETPAPPLATAPAGPAPEADPEPDPEAPVIPPPEPVTPAEVAAQPEEPPAPAPAHPIEGAEPVAPEPEETLPETPIEPETPPAEPEPEPEAKPRKPRAPRQTRVEEPEELTLESTPDSGDDAAGDEPEPARAVSHDGATRLLVTAYIGIGNRLFVRGDGPGLSPDKGVPLQFVSIGKWRWETSDATAPLHLRLYKNDDVECTALGEIAVEPGQQVEVAARF